MNFAPLPLSTVAGAFLLGFPTLFSIVNPIGAALIFYNVTATRSHVERTVLARQVAVNSLFILLGSMWLGSYVLTFFGVSLGALRVAGGLVVAARAYSLLNAPEAHQSRKERDAEPAAGEREDVAFFPLTMPFTTGPGSISVAIALASERPASGTGVLPFFGGLTLAAIAIALCVWGLYAFSDRALKLLGEAGARVVGRMIAFLLLCIGVQILASGAESLLDGWLLTAAKATR